MSETNPNQNHEFVLDEFVLGKLSGTTTYRAEFLVPERGLPDIRIDFGQTIIRPHTIIATWKDGRLREVGLVGRRVLKSGEVGHQHHTANAFAYGQWNCGVKAHSTGEQSFNEWPMESKRLLWAVVTTHANRFEPTQPDRLTVPALPEGDQ